MHRIDQFLPNTDVEVRYNYDDDQRNPSISDYGENMYHDVSNKARRDAVEARANKAQQRIEYHKEKERQTWEMQQIENAKKVSG